MKKRFLKIYILFVAVCLSLAAAFLIYTFATVSEYENSQPEKTVSLELEKIKSSVADGTFSSFPELGSAKFENADIEALKKDYVKTISNAELSCRVNAAEDKGLSKSYTLYADNIPFAKLTLNGENVRNKLFFFSMADWYLQSYEPLSFNKLFDLTVLSPNGVFVSVNGVRLSEDELSSNDGNVNSYLVKCLSAEPEIHYENADGTSFGYSIKNNTVSPHMYSYRFGFPRGIKVILNGEIISPDADGIYDINTVLKPKIILQDDFSETVEYSEQIQIREYRMRLPESFTAECCGKKLEAKQTSPHPHMQMLSKYSNAKLPEISEYCFSKLSDANVRITDNLGNTFEYSLGEDAVEILNESGQNETDSDISADAVKMAEKWSLFMTDDLKSSRRGYYEVCEMFPENSEYRKFANQWVSGNDINLVSRHSFEGFTDEKISDFVRLSDDCFSCRVSFDKHMKLYSYDKYVGRHTDRFDSIIYFVREDSDWLIAAIYDVK